MSGLFEGIGFLSRMRRFKPEGMKRRQRVLILDDDANRHVEFIVKLIDWDIEPDQAWSEREAIRLLSRNSYDIVFLDHDLGLTDFDGGSGTGVVRWILAHKGRFRDTRFVIHSINRVDGRRIYEWLRDAGLRAQHKPFAWELIVPPRKHGK